MTCSANQWTGFYDNSLYNERVKEIFPISRDTFKYILSEILVNIEKQHTTEEPISPEIRLAICLYKLSRKDYNYTISEMTGVWESTVICIVNHSHKETDVWKHGQ